MKWIKNKLRLILCLFLWFIFDSSENMVSDCIPDRKMASIAASLVAAAATANGNNNEKERELNVVITELQKLREDIIRQVCGDIS